MHEFDVAFITLAVTLLGTIVATTWKGAKLTGVLDSAIARLEEKVVKLESRSAAIDSIGLLIQRVDMVEKVVTAMTTETRSIRPSVSALSAEVKNIEKRLDGHSGELKAVRIPTGPEFRPVRRPSRPDTDE